MIYKLRLPLHLQPLRQPQHKQYTCTRMLELRPISTSRLPSLRGEIALDPVLDGNLMPLFPDALL